MDKRIRLMWMGGNTVIHSFNCYGLFACAKAMCYVLAVQKMGEDFGIPDENIRFESFIFLESI